MPLEIAATAVAHRQLLDRVKSVVEKSRRNRTAISVGAEAERLATEYRNCPMSHAELSDTIRKAALAAGVRTK
jgi:hypothetical protein